MPIDAQASDNKNAAAIQQLTLDIIKLADAVGPRIFQAMRTVFPHEMEEGSEAAKFDGTAILATGLALVRIGATYLGQYSLDPELATKLTAVAQALMRGDQVYGLPAPPAAKN